METKHFSLGTRDNSRFTRIIQIVFGIVCIAVAVYWLVYNFSSVRADWTLWITVVFLTGFGAYLIWSGLGFAYRYIEVSGENLKLKRNSFLPVRVFNPSQIEKIEIFPLKFTIRLKSSGIILTRLGVTHYETLELIKDEMIRYAEEYNIALEIRNESES